MSEAIHSVAEHLATHAKTLNPKQNADACGRSAFNRYYYASYLAVRELLGLLDAAWATQPHSGIPELLEKALVRRLKTQAKLLVAEGLLSHSKEQALMSQAKQASGEIASLLRAAYAVRVAADYEPSQHVSFEKAGFTLLGHSDAEARQWRARVEREKGKLINISKELGIV